MEVIIIVLLVLAVFTVGPFVVMWLWNATIADMFVGVGEIGFWQALGLMVLARLIFGSRTTGSKEE